MATATLRNLVSVRSRLVEDAITFLDRFADAVDRTPWEFGGRLLRVSSAFVEPVVFTRRELDHAAGERRAGDDGQHPTAKGASFPRGEAEQKLYERERRAGKHEEKRWGQVIRAGGGLRLIVKGEPGGGKSCATRHTAAQFARESATALRERAAQVEEVTLPLWTTAQHLAEQPATLGVADALLNVFDRQPLLVGALSPRLRAAWREQAVSARAFVVVDALDELPPGSKDALVRRLVELGNSTASVLVTCRTLSWDGLKHCVPWQNGRLTVELKPLEPRRQRAYAEKFFGFTGRPELVGRLEEMLRNLSLREHSRVPLILTLACGLMADGRFPTRPNLDKLYRSIFASMLSGAWRHSSTLPEWADNQSRRAEVEAFLPALAWSLFQKNPQGNLFNLPSWRMAFESAEKANGPLLKEPSRESMTHLALREDLIDLGLLVDGGRDEAGDPCWSFAHRTPLEFLAARGLRADPVWMRWLLEKQKPIKQNPFWFAPGWLPMLTFLAAIMGDATPLIQAVDVPPLVDGKPTQGDDIFRRMLGLKCRFAGAGETTPDHLIRVLAAELLHSWTEATSRIEAPLGWTIRRGLAVYIRFLANRPTFTSTILPELLERLRSFVQGVSELKGEKAWFRIRNFELIVKALGALGDRNAVGPLLQCLQSNNWSSRNEVVEALGELGDRAAVGPLIKSLSLNRLLNHRTVLEALDELGAPGNNTRVDFLLRIIRSESNDFRRRDFIKVLGELGDLAATSPLIEGLRSTNNFFVKESFVDGLLCLFSRAIDNSHGNAIDNSLYECLRHAGNNPVHEVIIKALGAPGDHAAVDSLLKCLDLMTNSFDRRTIIGALGALGDRAAVGPLIQCLRSEKDKNVRVSIIGVLGALGDRAAVGPLIQCLRSEKDKDVRARNIVVALGALGDRAAVDPLIQCLRSEKQEWRRWCIIGALGALGDRAAVDPLIQCLRSDKANLRRDYSGFYFQRIAQALGALGDRAAVVPLTERLNSGGAVGKYVVKHHPSHYSTESPELEHRRTSAIKEDRDAIIEAMVAIGDPIVVDLLLSLLRQLVRPVSMGQGRLPLLVEENLAFQDTLVKAIGELGNCKSVDPLLKCLEVSLRVSRFYNKCFVGPGYGEALWQISEREGCFIGLPSSMIKVL